MGAPNKKPKQRRDACRDWVLPCILVGLSLAVAWSVKEPLWAIDDDYVMASIMSCGLPMGTYAVFINACLSFFVAALYSVFPACAWWAICQVAIIAAGDIVLCRYLMQRLRGRRAPCVCGMLLCQLVCAGYVAVNIQFTITAGFACAVGLFFLLKDRPSRFECVVGVCFFVIGCMVRIDVGYVALAILAGCTLLRGLMRRFFARGNTGPYAYAASLARCGALVAALVALTALVNAGAYGRTDLREYLAFNDARSEYTDFPHVTYGERPDVYDAVGWDSDLATLANFFYSLDEAVTADSYRAIASVDAPRSIAMPTKAELFLMAAVMPVVGLFVFVRQDSYAARAGAAFVIAAFYGCSVLLLLAGRYPPRVLFAMVLVCFAAGMAHACGPSRGVADRADGRGRSFALRAITCALFVVLFVAAGVYLRRIWSPGERALEQVGVQVALDAYADAREHPDDVFVLDTTVANARYLAFDVGSYDAQNVVFWGGWEAGSPAYEARLESLGIAASKKDALLAENCYFMTCGSPEEPPRGNLRSRLQTVCGQTVAVVARRTYPSGLTVYKYEAK